MKLSDIKIGTRLAAAFAAVLALSIASAGLALHQISAVKSNLDDIVTVNNVKLRLNNDMSEAVHIVARVTRTVILLSDPAQMEEQERKIAAARASYDQAWQALQEMPASEEARAKRSRIEAARDAARPLTNQALELAHQGQDEAATTLLMTQAGPATQEWQDALDDNIRFQEVHNAAGYQAAQQQYEHARMVLVMANILSVAAAALLAWLVTRSITRPMTSAREVAERVAGGDLNVELRVEGRDETAQLLDALHRMKENLIRVVSDVRDNADGVATASSQIAQGNLDLSQRTEEQASNLQQTAASMEQLTATVKNNAETARQAAQLAGGASQVATRGGEVVGRVVSTMGEISAASQRIADIIGVVDGIAFQTNILALNAAVEAARAGEQGRGFAVVAGEVRTLAQRCAEAAKEIKQLIGASVQKVADGSQLVADAGSTMSDIVVQVRKVADLIGEIDSATAEQTSGIGQVNLAVTQLDQVTQQNAALVEESAAAADSLKHQAEKLVDTVRVFRMPQDAEAAALIARAKAQSVPARPALPKGRPAPAHAQEVAMDGAEWETF